MVEEQMRAAGVDWRMNLYSGAQYGTVASANDQFGRLARLPNSGQETLAHIPSVSIYADTNDWAVSSRNTGMPHDLRG